MSSSPVSNSSRNSNSPSLPAVSAVLSSSLHAAYRHYFQAPFVVHSCSALPTVPVFILCRSTFLYLSDLISRYLPSVLPPYLSLSLYLHTFDHTRAPESIPCNVLVCNNIRNLFRRPNGSVLVSGETTKLLRRRVPFGSCPGASFSVRPLRAIRAVQSLHAH